MNSNDVLWPTRWTAAVTAAVSAAVVVAHQTNLIQLHWLMTYGAGVAITAVTWFLTIVQAAGSGVGGWGMVYTHRLACAMLPAPWITWTMTTGWHQGQIITLLLAIGVVTAVSFAATPPQPYQRPVHVEVEYTAEPVPLADQRHPKIIEWERRLRQVTKKLIVVHDLIPWPNPGDGVRFRIELPADEGMTMKQMTAFTDNLIAAARLPRGCSILFEETETNGVLEMDVMLRDCIADGLPDHVEPTTEASIYDDVPIMTTLQGEVLSVCFRIMSVLVGGTTASGKTTLLHRLIMFLARCSNVLIWVVDLNGGGFAEPWIYPWANGKCKKPVVDWIADNEDEAAVMGVLACEIMKDRKTNRAAAQARREGKTRVLPLTRDMPGILIITDEGAELKKKMSRIGQIAVESVTSFAQIARAEGGRVMMSVLRGTRALLDRDLKMVAGIRICLRMEESSEYGYVLGDELPRPKITHTGAGYLVTAQMTSAVFGMTPNVAEDDTIERHAIACSRWRPELDPDALRVAARLSLRDIFANGRAIPADVRELPAMQDVEQGRAYTGRWERYADKLAAMRGVDPALLQAQQDEERRRRDDLAAAQAAPAASAPAGVSDELLVEGALGDFLGATLRATGRGLPQQQPVVPVSPAVAAPAPVSAIPASGVPVSPAVERVYRPAAGGARIIQLRPRTQDQPASAAAAPAVKTGRDHIMDAVRRETSYGGIRAADLERELVASGVMVRSRLFVLLAEMRESGAVAQVSSGAYVDPALMSYQSRADESRVS